MAALVIQVRLHDGRYHGSGGWPPAPARLFQALVAGAGISGTLGAIEQEALEWLEGIELAPVIAAPRAWQARRDVVMYVPNNDSDRIGGDPLRMAEIRTATKVLRPHFFDSAVPLVYAWEIGDSAAGLQHARTVCDLAERLYQFGRGVDMAWAWGETMEDGRLARLLESYPGRVWRPSKNGGGTSLLAPCRGSLESVKLRYEAYGKRFFYQQDGKSVQVVFRQPPRPRFVSMGYESPAPLRTFELRDPQSEGSFVRWPVERAHEFIVRLRDAAAARLKRAMPAQAADIDRVFVGRKADGTNDCDPRARVRMIPLPSIGHTHADFEIRRVLVEVPSVCGLRAEDVYWAFSGLDIVESEGGTPHATLVRAEEGNFARHYGVEDEAAHRVWRTVTPAALPESAGRRRIEPARRREEAKAGSERGDEQVRAAAAVCQALRHADVGATVEAVRVQREPWEGNGQRVEAFAEGTRFSKHRLWHVEVEFGEPVRGPLVIGDGRFLGLGVLAPTVRAPGIHAFAVDAGLKEPVDPERLARALRRAVMARAQEHVEGPLPRFFSGHEPDGSPADSRENGHLAFQIDPAGGRLLVVAPHILERRPASREEAAHLAKLDRALSGLSELRAAEAGVLRLRPETVERESDPLFRRSRVWNSLTPYRVRRHLRADDAREALARDLKAELRERGLPEAEVTLFSCEGVAGKGLQGMARLEFRVAVPGPILLGRNRFLGGGLFMAECGGEEQV